MTHQDNTNNYTERERFLCTVLLNHLATAACEVRMAYENARELLDRHGWDIDTWNVAEAGTLIACEMAEMWYMFRDMLEEKEDGAK